MDKDFEGGSRYLLQSAILTFVQRGCRNTKETLSQVASSTTAIQTRDRITTISNCLVLNWQVSSLSNSFVTKFWQENILFCSTYFTERNTIFCIIMPCSSTLKSGDSIFLRNIWLSELHGITTQNQKPMLFILTDVRASNPAFHGEFQTIICLLNKVLSFHLFPDFNTISTVNSASPLLVYQPYPWG